MNLIYSREVRLQIGKLHPELKQGIRRTLEDLVENPYRGKPLVRELQGFWSIPYKRYRIVYRIDTDSNHCQIHTIGHRREVYQDLAKNLPASSE